jgi:hypothetical protein
MRLSEESFCRGLFYCPYKKEETMKGNISERLFYKTRWIIKRYMNQEMFERGIPSEVPDLTGPIGVMLPAESIIEGNVLLLEGIQAIEDLICGLASPTKWDNGNARIGVGDNSTAASNNQSGLLAPTNKAWQAMNTSYPSRNNTTVTWQSIFDANTANFGWQEFTIVNAANDTGNNINRIANNQGTKVVGQIWTISVQLTLS